MLRFVYFAGLLSLGCREPRPPAAQAEIVADTRQLMTALVEPAADLYWAAVGTVIDSTGTHESVPTTNEEWTELWRAALVVGESGNLLTMPGRSRDQDQWLKLSRAMTRVAKEAAAAALARDTAAVFEVGGRLYETCTACHVAYSVGIPRPGDSAQAK
ncbi:MAG: hypothetical protein FJ206_01045 [Gemmatimonadetes bacterium]|nr:hypothetical protein [Gemmatimonadota bacterium]